MTQTITITRSEYTRMKQEIKLFRNIKLYKRLLEFENNLIKGDKYSRKDLGF